MYVPGMIKKPGGLIFVNYCAKSRQNNIELTMLAINVRKNCYLCKIIG